MKLVHKLISNNYPEDHKSECILLINCKNNEGKNIVIQKTKDDVEEARKVVEQIESYISKGMPLKKIAIFSYRYYDLKVNNFVHLIKIY